MSCRNRLSLESLISVMKIFINVLKKLDCYINWIFFSPHFLFRNLQGGGGDFGFKFLLILPDTENQNFKIDFDGEFYIKNLKSVLSMENKYKCMPYLGCYAVRKYGKISCKFIHLNLQHFLL